MRCAAGERCLRMDDERDLYEQADRYGIYAGKWHDECWDDSGYEDFVFDASYAGESLEEDW